MKLDGVQKRVLILAFCVVVQSQPGLAQVVTADESGLPLAEWLEAAEEVEELDWDIDVDGPVLRMDQRLEVVIRGRIRGRDLEDSGAGHELVLRSWVSHTDRDGWIAESGAIRYPVTDGLPDRAEVDFDVQVFVTPGDYQFWILLVDETTGHRNLRIERVEVDEVDDEPFPAAYVEIPTVEFVDMDWSDGEPETQASGDLLMPVSSERPLDIELIATLSAPEEWGSFGDEEEHANNMRDAIIALAQLDVERGSKSVSGLDLVRRRRVFAQQNLQRLDLAGFKDALDAANPGRISLDDLANRMDNPGFLRQFVEEQIEGRPEGGPDAPLKVLLFVTGVMRFDRDANVDEIEFDGDCDCVAYHIRIRQHNRDLFDQVESIIDPLDPETHSVLTPRDLRRAIGRIAEDLSQY